MAHGSEVTLERGRKGYQLREIPIFSVKYKDVFSLKNLYVMMHEMLMEEGWYGWEDNNAGMQAHSDLETLYSENVYQRGIHHGGKEMWIWWRAQKHHERPNSYFRNTLDIDWHPVGITDIEIVHQGKKMKVQKGELEIFFRARIISDMDLKWSKHPLLKHFKPFYENRINLAHIEKREKELWRDVYRIQNKVKSYLNLRTFMPTAEPFHPKMYGWESQF